jgi:transcriptional regulator with XRE-family HTH domain
VSRNRKVPLDFPKAEEPGGVLRNEVLKSRPTFFQRWAAGAPKRNVALQLVRMRAEAGYSQAEVARRAGWDEEFVSRLEEFSGPIPDDAIVARYAAACGRHASPRAAAPNGDAGRRPRGDGISHRRRRDDRRHDRRLRAPAYRRLRERRRARPGQSHRGTGWVPRR